MTEKLFYRNLSSGCEGPDVQALQILLIGLGHRSTAYEQLFPDGQFGKVTDAALKSLQVKISAVPNGILDPQTLSKLADYCGFDFSTVHAYEAAGS